MGRGGGRIGAGREGGGTRSPGVDDGREGGRVGGGGGEGRGAGKAEDGNGREGERVGEGGGEADWRCWLPGSGVLAGWYWQSIVGLSTGCA